MRAYVLALTLVLACGAPLPRNAGTTRAEVTMIPPQATNPTASAPVTRKTDPCATIRALSERSFTAGQYDEEGSTRFVTEWRQNDGAHCVRDRDGSELAWGLVVTSFNRKSSSAEQRLAFGVARVEPGRSVVIAPISAPMIGEHDPFEPIQIFDFDGDGTPEFFTRSGYNHEGSINEEAVLYTFSGGRIARYAPSKDIRFGQMEDIDKDGRPDLISYEIWEGRMSCGTGFPDQRCSPAFAWHSTSGGTFSATDEVAKNYVKDWCPARPAVVNTTNDVVCRLLYGDDGPKLDKSIARAFVPIDCDLTIAGKKQKKNANDEYYLMREATRMSPPFRF